MKKTMEIDAELLAEARAACGAATDTAAVHEGLRALVRHAAHQRMIALLGTLKEKGPVDVPRRREPARRTRSGARRRAA